VVDTEAQKQHFVLVVDDQHDTRESLQDVLEEEGSSVKTGRPTRGRRSPRLKEGPVSNRPRPEEADPAVRFRRSYRCGPVRRRSPGAGRPRNGIREGHDAGDVHPKQG
jgi:hypothetical protein